MRSLARRSRPRERSPFWRGRRRPSRRPPGPPQTGPRASLRRSTRPWLWPPRLDQAARHGPCGLGARPARSASCCHPPRQAWLGRPAPAHLIRLGNACADLWARAGDVCPGPCGTALQPSQLSRPRAGGAAPPDGVRACEKPAVLCPPAEGMLCWGDETCDNGRQQAAASAPTRRPGAPRLPAHACDGTNGDLAPCPRPPAAGSALGRRCSRAWLSRRACSRPKAPLPPVGTPAVPPASHQQAAVAGPREHVVPPGVARPRARPAPAASARTPGRRAWCRAQTLGGIRRFDSPTLYEFRRGDADAGARFSRPVRRRRTARVLKDRPRRVRRNGALVVSRIQHRGCCAPAGRLLQPLVRAARRRAVAGACRRLVVGQPVHRRDSPSERSRPCRVFVRNVRIAREGARSSRSTSHGTGALATLDSRAASADPVPSSPRSPAVAGTCACRRPEHGRARAAIPCCPHGPVWLVARRPRLSRPRSVGTGAGAAHCA